MTSVNLDTEVLALQNMVRSSAISVLSAVYVFANSHTEAEMRGWLVTKDLKVTKKSNPFTAAAKCATAEFINNKWTPNDQKASRLSRACLRLDEAGVPADGVEKYMEDKTIASIMRSDDNSGNTTDAADKETQNLKNYNLGVSYLGDTCNAKDVIKFKDDKFFLDTKAGLNIGWNLALVKVGNGRAVETIAQAGMGKEAVDEVLRSYANKKMK